MPRTRRPQTYQVEVVEPERYTLTDDEAAAKLAPLFGKLLELHSSSVAQNEAPGRLTSERKEEQIG